MPEKLRERIYESKPAISWYTSKAVIERDGGGLYDHMRLTAEYLLHYDEIDKLAELPLFVEPIETITAENHIVQESDSGHNSDQNNND